MIAVIDLDDKYQLMGEELKDLALRLKGIIDTAIDGIITIDQSGIIETINKAAATKFQYTEEELIGKNISMLMPQPHKSAHDGYLHSYTLTRKPKIIGIGREVTGLKKNGEEFPFRLAVSEVVLNDRIIFTGIIHDLTEVKEAENKLIRLNTELEEIVGQRTQELETTINTLLKTNNKLEKQEKELQHSLNKEKELNELKTRFVSMASHEFRTPLSTILSSANLISRYTTESQNENREKHIGRIKSAVKNLTGILNDFLSLSKIEEGKQAVKIESLDLEILCGEVIDELKGLMAPNQKIIHHHDESIGEIISDIRILKNVLFNILSNAIKYSKEDGDITCEVKKTEGGIQFIVKDDGIGIPEVDQKYLFERFFRASNVENIQGTGLGLNIVKRYLELIEGDITFKSIENKGTTFFINLKQNH